MSGSHLTKVKTCSNCGADMRLIRPPSVGGVLLYAVLNPLTIFDGGLSTQYHEEKMKCTGCGLKKTLESTPQAYVLALVISLVSLVLLFGVALAVIFRFVLWAVLLLLLWLIVAVVADAMSFGMHEIRKPR